MGFLEPGYLWGLWVVAVAWGCVRRRARVLLVLRCLVLAFLVVALAGPVLEWVGEPLPRRWIVLVDGSRSIAAGEEAGITRRLALMHDAARGARERGRSLVVDPILFGEACVPLEARPGAWLEVRDLPRNAWNREASRLGMALTRAASSARPGEDTAVLVMSDGNTGDDLESPLAWLHEMRIPIHVVPLDAARERGFEVLRLEAPRRVQEGESLELAAHLTSSEAGDARVRFLRDGKEIAAKDVALVPGPNVLRESVPAGEPGTADLVVEVVPRGIRDDFRENDSAHAVTQVIDDRRTLIVAPHTREKHPMAYTLENSGVTCDVITPVQFPEHRKDLDKYSAIVFENVPASSFDRKVFSNIEMYVHDTGGGFLMTGLEGSFGPGGYRSTPIERILPVSLPTSGFARTSAVVLLLDISESMLGEKLTATIEAAKMLIRELRDCKVAVLTFGSYTDVRIPLQEIEAPFERFDGPIDSVQDWAGGRTLFFFGIQEARSILEESHAENRHVIMISDGRPVDDWRMLDAMKVLRQEKITLSSVAIGNEGAGLLDQMARAAGGRFYQTSDLDRLTAILRKESSQVVRSEAVVRVPFVPTLEIGETILGDFRTADLPMIREYVGTKLKPRAEAPLLSPSRNPVLAHWSCGLGRTAVVTTPQAGPGAENWIRWRRHEDFWRRVLQAIRRRPTLQYNLRVEVREKGGRITVDALGLEGQYLNFLGLTARVAFQDEVKEVALVQTDSGRYEGSFEATRSGHYEVSLHREGAAEALARATAHRPATSETSGRPADLALLRGLASVTKGKVLPGVAQLEEALRSPSTARRQVQIVLWPLFASLAILGFALEIALRRLGTRG